MRGDLRFDRIVPAVACAVKEFRGAEAQNLEDLERLDGEVRRMTLSLS
jgi:hypothetical protein